MDYRIEQFEKFNDDRGQLVVFLRNSNLRKQEKEFGQIYFVTFKKKGVIRGNHYHKKWHEWFGVVAGKVKVCLEDVKTKERVEIILDANKKEYIRLEINPYIAHAIVSLTNYAALLNYADSEWYQTDSHHYKVIDGISHDKG